MNLAAATADMIARTTPRDRVGVVASVDAGTGRCTVVVAGEPIAALPWVGDVDPIEGASVLVSQGVVSVLSPTLALVPEQMHLAVSPAETVSFQWRRDVLGTVHRFWGAPQSAPTDPAWPTWDIQQGAWISDSPTLPGYARRATLVRYDLAAKIPAEATDVVMRLHLDRNFELTSNRAIVAASPVVQGITYDPLPDHSTDDTTTAPEPSYATGFADWRPGLVVPGESASFQVPDTWRDALLDGTLSGLGFASPETADEAWFRAGAPPWQNGYLLISYTPPPEEP